MKHIRIFHTNKPEYWWQLESNIFHGCDIFSPVAPHLAAAYELLQPNIGDKVQLIY